MKRGYVFLLVIVFISCTNKENEVNPMTKKWIKHSNGIPMSMTSQTTAFPLVVYAANNLHIYTGTTDDGVYFSSNQGASWSKISGMPSDAQVTTFTQSSTGQIFAGTTLDGIYILNGVWSRFKHSPPTISSPSSSASLHITNNILLSGECCEIAFTSISSSGNWSYRTGMTPVNFITGNSIHTFAGGQLGVFRSTNNGNSWVADNSGLPPNVDIQTLNIANGKIYAGTFSDGLYASTISGPLSWQRVNANIPAGQIVTTIVTSVLGDVVIVGTSSSGVYISKDYGLTWGSYNEGLFGADLNVPVHVESLSIGGNRIYGVFADGIYARTL